MTFRRLTSILLLVLPALTAASAQGNLLSPGTSGFGFSTGLAASRGTTSYGISTGYSFAGRFDIGLSAGRVNRNPSNLTDFTYSSHGTYVSPRLTVYIVRADESENEASIGVTAAYEHIRFNDPPPPISEDTFSGTVTIFEDVLPSSSTVKLQPVVSISVIKGETSQTLATAGFFFGFKDLLGKVAGISANIGYQTGNVTGEIQLSVVF